MSKLGPLGTSATYWPIVPAPGGCEDGEFDGMNGRGNRSTRPDSGLNPGRRGGKPAIHPVKSTGYRCDSRLGGPQSGSGRCAKEENSLSPAGIELRFLGGPASNVVTADFLRLINRKEERWEGVDWIHLAQDRDQWQVPVNRVINLRVP
jgi:hypothetical protein